LLQFGRRVLGRVGYRAPRPWFVYLFFRYADPLAQLDQYAVLSFVVFAVLVLADVAVDGAAAVGAPPGVHVIFGVPPFAI